MVPLMQGLSADLRRHPLILLGFVWLSVLAMAAPLLPRLPSPSPSLIQHVRLQPADTVSHRRDRLSHRVWRADRHFLRFEEEGVVEVPGGT